MADPDFAACFGRVVVEHAQMLRQERQVIFTLRSSAPLDKGLCARLTASLQPDYEGFELRIHNLFGYPSLNETALRELNSFESIAVSMAEGRFQGYDPYRFPEIYDSITAEDILTFLKENFTREHMALSVISPKEEAL